MDRCFFENRMRLNVELRSGNSSGYALILFDETACRHVD